MNYDYDIVGEGPLKAHDLLGNAMQKTKEWLGCSDNDLVVALIGPASTVLEMNNSVRVLREVARNLQFELASLDIFPKLHDFIPGQWFGMPESLEVKELKAVILGLKCSIMEDLEEYRELTRKDL